MMGQHTFVRAFIGLGSNLDEPKTQILRAIAALRELPLSRLTAVSRLYRSMPMGPADQPDYINAVAMIDTRLPPLELLDALQAIEQAQGRIRGAERWGPRTLDLDILLYGAEQIDSERLVVPHPGLAERSFVLYPLSELSPELVLPDGRVLCQLLAECPRDGLEPLPAEGDG